MKKLTVLLFAVVCLSLSATSVLAVPPFCGDICQSNYNSDCYCESTCQITSCQVCQSFLPFAELGLTPSWIAEAQIADDAQAAAETTAETTAAGDTSEVEPSMSDD